jgi:hypothetical protein
MFIKGFCYDFELANPHMEVFIVTISKDQFSFYNHIIICNTYYSLKLSNLDSPLYLKKEFFN